MDSLVLFHRSFVDVTDRATYKHNMWVGKETYERQPVSGSFPGYQWLPKALRPLDLRAKPTQSFKRYATAWEERCSPLAGSHSGALFSPVVSPQETPAGFPVIAHHGVVGGMHLIFPRVHMPRGGTRPTIRSLLERDIPVYVTNQPYPDAGDWTWITPDSVLRFTVLTDVEGRVPADLGVQLKDDSIESVDPFAFLTLGKIDVAIGKGIGERLIVALARRVQQRAVIKSLSKEMAHWGKLMPHGASIEGWKIADLQEIRSTMQRVMGELIDGGTSTIKAVNLRALDRALERQGFKLFQAQPFGPQGGYQLFYRNGRVVARVKTRGDAGGPRAGVTHASFSLSDGWGLRWEHDIAKITKSGGFAPKNIVSLDDWVKNNMGASQNLGSRNFWYAVRKDHTKEAADAWANSTHFNARSGFGLEGIEDIVKKVPTQAPK